MRTLNDVELAGKRALVRVDFNVPMDESGRITDDTRIVGALPTLQALSARGVRQIVLMSHLGRPKGYDPDQSLGPVAEHLSRKLGKPVHLLPFDLDQALAEAEDAPAGSVLMLENTRFYEGEEQNSRELAEKFARFGDVYINDAFGAAHRAHASTEAIAHILPSAAGLLLQREVDTLRGVLTSPARPFVAVLGGAKVSDKIGVIRNLLPRVDLLLIGGAMANTFMLAQGREVGKSLVERDKVDLAKSLLEGEQASKIVLPVDLVVARSLDEPETAHVVRADEVPPEEAVFDIGPETAERYKDHITGAATVVWNGPMGVFEVDRFAEGTVALAKAVASSMANSVIGGGDSVAAVEKAGMASKIDHISTGGGASLELLEGKTLPGVAALEDAHA